MSTERPDIDQAQAVQIAYQYYQVGNLPQAKACLIVKLEAEPSQYDALHLFGICLHQEGNSELAAEYLLRAISVNPQFFAVYNTLGKIYFAQKRWGQALACFQKELSLQATDNGFHLIAQALVMLGRLDEAIATLEAAVRFNPSCKQSHLYLVKLY